MFTESHKQQIIERLIDLRTAEKQVEALKKGFPFVELDRPCTLGDGIVKLSKEEQNSYLESYEQASKADRFSSFIPASGAASRMFKALLVVESKCELGHCKPIAELEKGSDEEKKVFDFLSHLEDFPFHKDLLRLLAEDGLEFDQLWSENNYKVILQYVLFEKGLNFANLPKGLIAFHQSQQGQSRTAFEEHLVEASKYVRDPKGTVKCHFTINPEFQNEIQVTLQKTLKELEAGGCHFDISYSAQKASTDTLALNQNNELFLTDDKLLFRPGGHGALIENLNELAADIVFIKNIDNVLPEKSSAIVVEHQKLLGGMLANVQQRIFEFLERKPRDKNLLNETTHWVSQLFGFQTDENEDLEDRLVAFLNRPIRVCGMVKNEGEPGGGPFWIKDTKGRVSAQIVEKSQIDFSVDDQKKKAEKSTHFNPVNLVCGLKNYQGKAFDLSQYIDRNTGFVSEKSYEGRALKALELPGLWNGAMADWLTVFVDVPIETFAPVKELNDLLRPAHQSWRESNE